jgi:Ca-activated chloride channel family protein
MSALMISELANKRICEWTKAAPFAYSHIALIAVIALVAVSFSAFAQKGNDLITEGNKLYEKGEYSEAEVRYRKAETEKGNAFISKFNLGDAMFKQQRYEEAAAAFGQLPALTEDKKQKAAAYHNLGNSLLKTKKYQESVDAYKQALRNDPKDEDTKYNLSYARRMLQQQQEQQKQDQDKKDDKKEDKKDEQQQQTRTTRRRTTRRRISSNSRIRTRRAKRANRSSRSPTRSHARMLSGCSNPSIRMRRMSATAWNSRK